MHVLLKIGVVVQHRVHLQPTAGAATVPWEQLVAVVSSDALQEPPSPCADKQPQVVQ